ncbi:MAG: TPM domain-containing protein [Ignavibacteria bacterium]
MSRKNIISEYLSDEELDKIAGTIGEIEKKTSGEIRVCIKRRRGFLEKKDTPREIAMKEFVRLKMHETRDKTGVLFFLIFNERKFEIVADEGINSKISPGSWNEISGKLTDHFINKNYHAGITKGLIEIGEVLIREFPVRDDDRNELPDDVIINP